MKKWWVLAAVVILVSCELLPEMEGEYPVADLPEFPEGEAASISLPVEEPSSEQNQEQTELPAPALDLAETNIPEVAPEERIPAPPLPAVPPVVQTTRAPAPAPAVQTPPQTPPVAAAVSPQQEMSPAPSATVPPPEPLPPQQTERESPSVPIPDMPFQPVSAAPAESAEKDLHYSRTVRVLTGQYIEIPFRGPGWVYLGEFGSRRGVNYESRRIEDEGMTFVFRAEKEGTYSLRFNRQDFVRDFILNDFVKVIVEEPPRTTGSAWSNPRAAPERVYASPRWPPAADPLGTTAGTANGGTAAVPPAPAAVSAEPPPATAPESYTGPASPPEAAASAVTAQPAAAVPVVEDWLQKAREEYNGGRIAGALSALDQFMLRYPGGSDEAYWLYGQSLEAHNEATRNIRLALDYYRRLVREYPQSSRYDDARQRIAYLERYYFTIQ
jgi:hypothetical protein